MRTIMVAAMFAALAAPAFADSVWTATPATPADQASIVAGEVEWACDKSAGCHTTTDTSTGDSNRACRTLAGSLGPLSAFTGNHTFDAGALARCNQSAKR